MSQKQPEKSLELSEVVEISVGYLWYGSQCLINKISVLHC